MLFERMHGNVTFLARNKTLDQLNADIISGLPETFSLRQPLTVYCGIHTNFQKHYFRHGCKLGIQTEQLADQHGCALWKASKVKPAIEASQVFFDQVLDLNRTNRSAYAVGAPLDFGPFIFPSCAPPFSMGVDPRSIFFGSVTGFRRPRILAEAQAAGQIRYYPEGLFGEELAAEVAKHTSVANIHFDEGVYTEYPRLLSALLAGKPVLSEQLTEELIPGTHYMLLDKQDQVDQEVVFEQFSSLFCGKYSFENYLLQQFS